MDRSSLKTFDEETIREAAHKLLAAAPPGSRVILFGSYARGEETIDSDLDFLVIEPGPIESVIDEMVRLRRSLDPLRVAADVLVVTKDKFDRLSSAPGTVHHWAANEGRTFSESQ